MSRIIHPNGMTDIEARMMLQAQQQEQARNMHFTTALHLYTKWSDPNNDEARNRELAAAATEAASILLQRYGCNIRFVSPEDQPAPAPEGEADGRYIDQ